MPVVTRVRSDGVTSETMTTIKAPLDETDILAFVREHNRRATFAGRIADLERVCRQTPGRRIEGHEPPPRCHSRQWYAEEILLAISAARQWLESGHADFAASEAVVVGALAAEAEARHNWPELKRWNEYRAKQHARSIAGIQAKRDNTARHDQALLAAVRAAYLKHPDYSRRAIASTLLSQYGRSGDRRKAIDALAKRIARLSRRE